MKRNPPKLAVALLNILVPDEERESIPGDLAEEFATAHRSSLWYWGQVARSFGYLAWRSFGRPGLSILAGYAAMAAAVVATTIAIEKLLPGWTPGFGYMLVNLIYSALFVVAGGYVTAWLAGRSEIRNSLALGVLCLAMGGYWLFTTPALEPHWYRISLVALGLPSALLGGYLRSLRPRHLA